MKLKEYFEMPGAKTMQEVAEESTVSYQTIKAVARGMTLERYDLAKKVSLVTTLKGKKEPQVSIPELCE